MRILIIGLNFEPEIIGVGKYSGEMAAWLARRGYDVSVITTQPYYPQRNKPAELLYASRLAIRRAPRSASPSRRRCP